MTAVMMVLCVAAFAQDGKSIYNKYSDKENVSADQLYVLIDRMSVSSSESNGSRLTESVETAFYEGNGACRLVFLPSNIIYDYSTRFESDGIVFEQPNDNMFSFNSPLGASPYVRASAR